MLETQLKGKKPHSHVKWNHGPRKRHVHGAVPGGLEWQGGRAGEITDHENGTYTARFRAGWSSRAAVQVHVIHPLQSTLPFPCSADEITDHENGTYTVRFRAGWGEITDHENGTYTTWFRAEWSGRATVQVYVIHPLQSTLPFVCSAGEITDHENGTYTVRFRAGWSGRAAVQVHVIHPREAIDVLRRLRDVERKRVNACSFVQDGSTEWTRCWTTPSRDPAEQECDFSHAPSGTDWYCKKPVRAPCSAIDKCSGGGLIPLEDIGVTETDKMLFNETFIDQAVMDGTILWVQVTEQDVPCVIRHGSGNCLYASDPDVDGSDPLRRRVVLWPCTDSVRQVFALRHDGKIIHLYSGLCVGVINDNSTDHGQIVLR
ncbi:uncharacterized protein LOC144877415 [Branchiostoma floridae x Branchiostoma japonicum]